MNNSVTAADYRRRRFNWRIRNRPYARLLQLQESLNRKLRLIDEVAERAIVPDEKTVQGVNCFGR